MDPLVTIKNLIALACSSHSEEESRTSALAACKAIARHEVVLTLPGQARAEQSVASNTDPFSPFTRQRPRPSPPPTPEPPRSSPPKPRAKKEQNPFGQRPKHPHEGSTDKPVRMASRYEAWCKGCGGQCKVSETIWWKKGVGVTCETCGPRALERSL